jgi:formylglycine-generating enzyme required for sulfatase activity
MRYTVLVLAVGVLALASCERAPVKPPEGVVKIPGGKFFMGYEDGAADEKPEHEVEISEFYVAATEVTNADYERFDPTHKTSRLSGGNDMPVCNVSWEQAVDYCRWLSRRNPGTYRLPTEAEWEYAARGPKGYLFGYGDTYSKGEAATDTEGATSVREHKPNGFELYGMSGNASEWVFDNYDANYYQKLKDQVSDNPRGPEGKLPSKTIRGPSFLDKGDNCRVTKRRYASPGSAQDHVGFRYVWEP